MQNYDVEVVRKSVKHLRMRVIDCEAGNAVAVPNSARFRIVVSAPKSRILVSDAKVQEFVQKNAQWVKKQISKMLSKPQIRRVTDQQLLDEAMELISHWQKCMGVQAQDVKLRKMKTRWGVCNVQTGKITFNSELAKYPYDALEYVAIHELSHLAVRPKRGEGPHSARFWENVAKYMPDYKRRRALLK
jgi:predicted metal-dependent hydrolase